MNITKPIYKVRRHKDGTYTVHTKKGSTLVRKVLCRVTGKYNRIVKITF